MPIRIRGASLHNLKGIDLDIPTGRLAFITGPSGSGKTSLAFDTLGAEGQRRYLETFSSYARQFLATPASQQVQSIQGLPPAVLISQRNAAGSPKSTVGTLTQLHDLLRLLFARLGTAPESAVLPLRRSLFSFHHSDGACPLCQGLGVEDRLAPELLVADPARTLRQGALAVSLPNGYLMYSQVTLEVLDQVCHAHGFDVDTPWQALTEEQRKVVLYGSDRLRVPYGKHPLESRLKWKGIPAKPRQEGVYQGILPVMEQILRRDRNPRILRFVRSQPCSACRGRRLRPEALAVTFRGFDIARLSSLPMDELQAWFGALAWQKSESAAGEPIRQAAARILDVLLALGVGYLPLDRAISSLSSGELQRLRLASIGGLGLSGVLYVLDEPSAGMHPADQDALRGVLTSLRDQGNSVVIVEHEQHLIEAADWIADIGPGAGPDGGQLLFAGSLEGFLADCEDSDPRAGSATRAFLRRDRHILPPDTGNRRRLPMAPMPLLLEKATRNNLLLLENATRNNLLLLENATRNNLLLLENATRNNLLLLENATRNNLRGVDARFLIGAFNVVSGVSGAGKSSLVEELVDRLSRGALPGSESIGKVVALDSSPIGRTPRSNPATYTGIADRIRDLFASLPEAKSRGLSPGAFSFNVEGGRCPDCEGAGVKQLGMRFLGTLELRCESCLGKRFLDHVLEVRFRDKSIHDVLETPVHEALELFSDQPKIRATLALLEELGLGYLPLGHPATDLSGGEAQRIKLASELVQTKKKTRCLYVLDEPTVGLHPADVERFLIAIQHLVGQGHTVIAVEHDLDVIRSADHVIDLGPGSGSHGGTIVASGPPESIAACNESLTGRFLGESAPDTGKRRRLPMPPPFSPSLSPSPSPSSTPSSTPSPSLSPSPSLPPSGSPHFPAPVSVPSNRQSPVASRRSPVHLRGVKTRNLKNIDVEFTGITVVTGVSGSGKTSLAFDTLFAEGRDRFLEAWSAWGRRYVPRKQTAVFEQATGLTPTVGVRQAVPSRNPRSTVGTMTGVDDMLRLLVSRGSLPSLPASHFSPNTEHGACLSCKGLCFTRKCLPERLITRPDQPLFAGAMDGHEASRLFGDPHGQHAAIAMAAAASLGFDLSVAWQDLLAQARDLAMHGTGDSEWDVVWNWQRGRRSGAHSLRAKWPGLARLVEQEYERKHGDARGDELEPLLGDELCEACSGDGVREPARSIRFEGLTISEWRRLPVSRLIDRLRELLESRPELALALRGSIERLDPLLDAGLGYLTLSRPAPSLSSGEAQRVRLASHVVSGLSGITYVLDEPTRGLHARDSERVVRLVRGLRDQGNTVVVVEHDLAFLRHADHVVDLGPGAGQEGGKVVVAGTPSEVEDCRESLTGKHLRASRTARALRTPRPVGPGIEIRGACAHNLKGIDLDIPAGGLIAITGVSGSGKSTLAFEVIAASFRGQAPPVAAGCKSIRFLAPFSELIRGEHLASPSSSALVASHTGVLDEIRRCFASTPAARANKWKADHFSFAARGGRCEACEGTGVTRVGLDFLPDAAVECEICEGTRFNPEALACKWKGLSIADVLAGSVRDLESLAESDAVVARLHRLDEIGLGYLRLGQPLSSLSGGERQRLGLALALDQRGSGARLILLDEPTAGLHPEDVSHLIPLLERLVEAGDTILVVDHDLALIRAADWIVDLGPEGGDGGGRVVAQGTPQEVGNDRGSATGAALAGVVGR